MSEPSTPAICALKLRIENDMKDAMRQKDKDRLSTIRLAMAAFKQKEVDERIVLSDEQVLQILEKMIKQRRESIRQFNDANRLDLSQKEQAEIDVLSHYLPQALSPEEINHIVAQTIAELQSQGLSGPQLMGQVMGKLKPQLQGRADMSQVSQLVKSKLA